VLDFDDVNEAEGIIGEHLFPHYDIAPRRAAVRDSRRAAGDWQRDYLSLVMAAEN
jgi:hypothetical protein